jgi:hypothetical protein
MPASVRADTARQPPRVGPVDYGVGHGTTGGRSYPGGVIGTGARDGDDEAMQVITAARGTPRPSLLPIVGGTIVATMLVVGGLILAYAAFATPLLAQAIPAGRPSAAEMALGMALWAAALVAPAGFILIGTTRLARNLASVREREPRRSTALRALADVPSDVVVASGLVLPDGRGVSELVIGPFGAAVVRELPPATVTRIRDGQWELRTSKRWIPLENPLDRASRDAERVRRWLGHDDADFVVKVYAAVVGPEPTVERTAGCAVLASDQLGPWITALPAQRSLTAGRREQILELVRDAAN